MRQAIRNQGDVALAFTKRILLQENEEADNSNVVVSPLSIHLVLSLVAAGSSGFFLDQLLSFLKFSSLHQLNQFAAQIASIVLADGSSSGGPRLAFPNGVWVEQSLPLKHSFEHLVHNVYKANLCPVDFRTKVIYATLSSSISYSYKFSHNFNNVNCKINIKNQFVWK